jgi:hypothetical protein
MTQKLILQATTAIQGADGMNDSRGIVVDFSTGTGD